MTLVCVLFLARLKTNELAFLISEKQGRWRSSDRLGRSLGISEIKNMKLLAGIKAILIRIITNYV